MTTEIELKRQVEELQEACSGYTQELAKREQKIAALSSRIDELTMLIQAGDSIGGLSRKLYGAVDNRIMGTINRKGAYRDVPKKKHPSLDLAVDETVAGMLSKLQQYDDEEFFVYRKKVKTSHLRLHYRVAAKMYRTSRDTSMKVLRKAYHKAKERR